VIRFLALYLLLACGLVAAAVATVREIEAGMRPLLIDNIASSRTAAPSQGVFMCTEHVGPRRPRPLVHYREIS
jgi:hypothetical protein